MNILQDSFTSFSSNGLNLFESPLISNFKMVQYRFPKSKGKRINKKWSKNRSNWREETNNDVFIMGDSIFGSPAVMDLFHVYQKREPLRWDY